MNKRPPCIICGQPATNGSQDVREIEPVRDKDGVLWANWIGLGFRYGCDKHPQLANRIYRIGDKDYPVRIS